MHKYQQMYVKIALQDCISSLHCMLTQLVTAEKVANLPFANANIALLTTEQKTPSTTGLFQETMTCTNNQNESLPEGCG